MPDIMTSFSEIKYSILAVSIIIPSPLPPPVQPAAA